MRGRAGPGRLRHRVLDAIREHSLWAPDHAVAVAVSGGLDSLVLLQLLVDTQPVHGARLSVVTVDHGTRPESAADADFVCAHARGLGLPVARADLALGQNASEATLREARHRVFAALEVDRVALAHHRDDQAETVLLHLLRGTGTRGLAAMGWRRDHLVRPLLDSSRTELEAYAEHRELAWREDATNRDPRFLRNRLRAEVMPLLEGLRPGAAKALARSAAVAAQDDAWLEQCVRDWRMSEEDRPGFSVDRLRQAPAALVGRLLLAEVAMRAGQVSEVLALVARGQGTVDLGERGCWRIEAGRLRLEPADTAVDGAK